MSENKKFFLTPEGFAELNEELEYLKLTKRPEVVNNLKEAKALGDLSENAEYDSARNEQASVEGRIKEIEHILDHYILVAQHDKTKVNIGSKVKILYLEDNSEEVYAIVGKTEADPFQNKISNESELAQALIGKKAGSKIEVNSSAGKYQIKLLEIIE